MENEEKIQCLVGWNTFFSDTSSEKYPPILCFPEYFLLMINTARKVYLDTLKIIGYKHLFKNPKDIIIYENIEKIQYGKFDQIKRFLSSLQIVVDLIFLDNNNNNNNIIKVKPFDVISSELMKIVDDELRMGNQPGKDFYFLENYLVDDGDRENYQNALLQMSLKHHNATSVENLIEILYKEGSCKDIDKTPIPKIPIPSIHFAHQVRISNETDYPKDRIGPRAWGPFFWNIFHALAQNASQEMRVNVRNGCYTKDQLSTFLYGYIQYLPLLIPCSFCSIHFYETIHPGAIPYSSNVQDYENIYNKIHKRVTEKVNQTSHN